MDVSDRPAHSWPSRIGLLVIIGLIFGRVNQAGEKFLGLSPLQSRDLFWWPLLGAVLVYIVAVERKSLNSIGLKRPTWMTLVSGVGFALLLTYGIGPISDWIVSHSHLAQRPGSGSAIASLPLWRRVLLLARASLAEEVVFRGYVIGRTQAATGSKILATLLSVAMFAFAHLAYWGWAPLIFVSLAGLTSAIQYLWSRDLFANILTHFIADAIAIL
jgi:membrane protease YdiL (CAAX protease family)